MRFQTRPTWLAVAVGAVTGFVVGRPGLLIGAIREDGLPFLVLVFVLVGVATVAWRDTHPGGYRGR